MIFIVRLCMGITMSSGMQTMNLIMRCQLSTDKNNNKALGSGEGGKSYPIRGKCLPL